MAKFVLSERFVASPKRVPPSGRVDFPDALVPGLALRVTSNGHRSYVLITRYPSSRPLDPDKPWHPSRRALGAHGELSLDTARERARQWLALVRKGKDPKIEEARERAAEQRKQAITFKVVAEQFVQRHVANLVKAADARHVIEAEFVKRWGNRPVTDILPEECATAIRAIVNRGSPYQAHNSLGYLRRLFNWAIGTSEFGISVSPVERLRARDLIGKREARDRILTDDELRAVWRAAGDMGYPYGPVFRLLILTGQREREVAKADRHEIDFSQALWTMPAARMKGDRAHEVPLAPMALEIFRSLPEWGGGPYLFTTMAGAKPVNGFGTAKERIDKLCGVAGWKIHDLRRTTRTHFSALPVQDNVRELVIAHARPGLHKVYDLHAYQSEKRECLELWERRLAGILAPLAAADATVLSAERDRRRGRSR